MVRKVGADRESSKTLLDDTQHPPQELEVGGQGAYLAQVVAEPRRQRLPRPPCSAPGSLSAPLSGPAIAGLSARGAGVGTDGVERGHWHAGQGVGATWGPPPSLVVGQEGDPPGLQNEGRGGLS